MLNYFITSNDQITDTNSNFETIFPHVIDLCICSYEPELFPGLIYRMVKPRIVLLIFVSGKVVLTGAWNLILNHEIVYLCNYYELINLCFQVQKINRKSKKLLIIFIPF